MEPVGRSSETPVLSKQNPWGLLGLPHPCHLNWGPVGSGSASRADRVAHWCRPASRSRLSRWGAEWLAPRCRRVSPLVHTLPVSTVFPDVIHEDMPGSWWEVGHLVQCVLFHTHIQMTQVVFANSGPFPRPQCLLVMYQAPVEAWDFLCVCPWACLILVAGLDNG